MEAGIGTYVFLFAVVILVTGVLIYKVIANKHYWAKRFQEEFGVSKNDPKAREVVANVLSRKKMEVIAQLLAISAFFNDFEEKAKCFDFLLVSWHEKNEETNQKIQEFYNLRKFVDDSGFPQIKFRKI